MEDKVSTYTVFETEDYSKFKVLLGNRAARTEARIIESIKAIGSICLPIVVNENYEVIDGQNRLKAWEALKLPVWYIVIPGLGIKEARWLNVGRSNWGTEDYIESYAETGSPDYRRLSSLNSSFKKRLSLQGVLAMAKPTKVNEGGVSCSYVKNGELKLSQEEYELAITRMKSAQDLGYASFVNRKKLPKRIFWSCISYIYQHQEVNAKDVIEKLIKYEATIPGCNRVSDQLKFIEDAYNRDVRGASKKVFLSADFQRREYL